MKKWRSEHAPELGFSSKELLQVSREIADEYFSDLQEAPSELVLMPLDPYHLHAYWNIGPDYAIQNPSGKENRLILRVYWLKDETSPLSETPIWFDVEVRQLQGQRRIRSALDDSAYTAELGLYTGMGKFLPLLHSNLIHVPKASMFPQWEADHKPSDKYAGDELGRGRLPREKTGEGALSSQGRDLYEVEQAERLEETLIRVSLPSLAAKPTSEAGVFYDEALIDSLIQQTLREKGIDVELDVKQPAYPFAYLGSQVSSPGSRKL